MQIKLVFPDQAPVKKNSMHTMWFKENANGIKVPLQTPIKYPSDAWKKWAKDAVQVSAVHKFNLEEQGYVFPISKPLIVTCIFFRKDNYVVDVVNLLQGIYDLLIGKPGITLPKTCPSAKFQMISDDNKDVIVSTGMSRVFMDTFNPRTEIFITEVDSSNWRTCMDILYPGWSFAITDKTPPQLNLDFKELNIDFIF